MVPFWEQPPLHLLEIAAKAQQDGASKGWEPNGRGGRPRGRQGGGGGHLENPVFAWGFLVSWAHLWWQQWSCVPFRSPPGPAPCLWEHARRDSLWGTFSSSVMVGLYHQVGGRRDLIKLTVHALLPHLLTRKLRSREGKPPTQGHTVSW